jgi:hypothetical protein
MQPIPWVASKELEAKGVRRKADVGRGTEENERKTKRRRVRKTNYEYVSKEKL